MGLNDSNQDCMDIIIRKFEKQSSIQMTEQSFRIPKKFSLQLAPRMMSKDNNSKCVGGGR